jgi:hypothetical protein
VHKHPVPGLDIRSLHQRRVRRGHRHEETCGFEERPTFWHGLELLGFGANNFGVAALRGAEDFVADGVVGASFGRGGGDGGDYATEFGAGDPGEGRLVLIFSADLEKVEEVRCGAVDADCVLVWGWGWIGEVDYDEVLGALERVLDSMGA